MNPKRLSHSLLNVRRSEYRQPDFRPRDSQSRVIVQNRGGIYNRRWNHRETLILYLTSILKQIERVKWKSSKNDNLVKCVCHTSNHIFLCSLRFDRSYEQLFSSSLEATNRTFDVDLTIHSDFWKTLSKLQICATPYWPLFALQQYYVRRSVNRQPDFRPRDS